jgi:outer membrane protein OmpA-like peptidoglycan-associated protein
MAARGEHFFLKKNLCSPKLYRSTTQPQLKPISTVLAVKLSNMASFRPIVFLPLFLPIVLAAQNLVVNPSFERLKPDAVVVPCEFMQYSQFFTQNIQTWSSMRDMTPDLLRAAENCPWLTQAHSGEYCAGIVSYLPGLDISQPNDYHEVLQGQLSAPLKPGQKYRVEIWVREDSSIIVEHLKKVYTAQTQVVPLRAGNLGFVFALRAPDQWASLWSLVDNKMLRPQVIFAEVIATKGQWSKLSATFVPDQPFQCFSIGNFTRDKLTINDLSPEKHQNIEQKNAAKPSATDRTKRAAYLCVDDVFVGLESPPLPPPTLEAALLRDRKFTFSAGVLFDSGKADLRPAAASELDSLVAFLKKRPSVRIGLSGHTDDVGSDADNLDLSERRARAVLDYLVNAGIAATRLMARGFGEGRPVADNLTEEGRQANRRVECVVLKNP